MLCLYEAIPAMVSKSFLTKLYKRLFKTKFEKTMVFNTYFLENSKNVLILTKSSIKFGEYLNFRGFSKIYSLIPFWLFSTFLECSRRLKKSKKILENPRNFKNSLNLLDLVVKIRKFVEFKNSGFSSNSDLKHNSRNRKWKKCA